MNSLVRTIGLTNFGFQSFNLAGAFVSAGLQVRYASKKSAGGGNRNKKEARGSGRGWKFGDGARVLEGDVLATQTYIHWLPGLNVEMFDGTNLRATKPGIVRITAESCNLDWSHPLVINCKSFAGLEGLQFKKKYYNVITQPQHNRFICIRSV